MQKLMRLLCVACSAACQCRLAVVTGVSATSLAAKTEGSRIAGLQSASYGPDLSSRAMFTLALPSLQVRRVSHGHQQDQFLLGSYSTSPWSSSGAAMLALKPKPQDNKLSIGLLKASNTTAGKLASTRGVCLALSALRSIAFCEHSYMSCSFRFQAHACCAEPIDLSFVHSRCCSATPQSSL